MLVAAVAALSLTPPALAHSTTADAAGSADACPAPDVVRDYDGDHFSVHATLLASGCAAREHRQFPLWIFVSRTDEGASEGHDRVVFCGPFRSAADTRPGDGPAPSYSCDVDMTLDHPSVEAAHYRVEVTYPGRDGDRTDAFGSLCESSADGTSCSDEYHPQ